ncbi:hypothetical protein HN873_052700, partial [Arachis hypogaea]
NNRIGCTLFGEMVDQIRPHLEEENVEPLIIVLQYFKTSRLLSGAPLNSIRISQLSSQGAWSAADELKQGSVAVKTIEEALNVAEVAACWIAATIISINAGKNDWFYKACRKCPKKVETSTIERY